MGEILSKDTVSLLRNSEVRNAVRTLVEREVASSRDVAPVDVRIPDDKGLMTVSLWIASS